MHVHRVGRAGWTPILPERAGDAMHIAEFGLLDVDLTLVSNRRRLLEPVRALLAAFKAAPGAAATEPPDQGRTHCNICIESVSANRQRLTIDGRRFEITGSANDLLGHLYAVLFDTLFERTRTALLIHGAALVKDGEATIISGPSGTGKSTLAFVGARRFEWELASDDVAPLDPASGRVRPFPKALSIRRGVLEPDALGPHVDFPVLGGRAKSLFQPADVGIRTSNSETKLKRVVFLSRPDRGLEKTSRDVTVVVHRCSDALTARICDSMHVEDVRQAPPSDVDSPYPHLNVLFKNELRGMWDLTEACRAEGALVLGVNKTIADPGEKFLDAPLLDRMDLESASRALLRNLWGTAQFGGSTVSGAALFGCVAAALKDVECVRLVPGPFEATLESLRTTIDP